MIWVSVKRLEAICFVIDAIQINWIELNWITQAWKQVQGVYFKPSSRLEDKVQKNYVRYAVWQVEQEVSRDAGLKTFPETRTQPCMCSPAHQYVSTSLKLVRAAHSTLSTKQESVSFFRHMKIHHWRTRALVWWWSSRGHGCSTLHCQ